MSTRMDYRKTPPAALRRRLMVVFLLLNLALWLGGPLALYFA